MTEPTSRHDTGPTTNAEASTVDDAFRVRARALGDPTRHAIYRRIAREERPIGVGELTDAFGLNHNTIRRHLGLLRDAGLVDEITERAAGPGRPRLKYRLTTEAAADWNSEGPYERLSLLLLEVATTGTSPLEVGRAAGRSMAIDPGIDDPVEAMTAALAAQGFAPRVAARGDSTEVLLDHCPFAAAATANPAVVCALHRGMLEGVASRIDDLGVVQLVAEDPRRAPCLVRVGVGDSGDAEQPS
ncbi:MAG: helix-turn-helix domain-containing protein [Actinobacteria bacterium]|nr:helix-turn-helix domain-containing protein [Actinomycetota bacterium]